MLKRQRRLTVARPPCRVEGSGVAGPAQTLELAAETLVRPALSTHDQDRRSSIRDDGRAVVDIAGDGDRRSDTRFDRPNDLDDPVAIGDARVDPVARADLGRRFRRRSVHADVAALAQLRRKRAGLHEAHSAEPAIDSRLACSAGVSHAFKDRTDRGGVSSATRMSKRRTCRLGVPAPIRLRVQDSRGWVTALSTIEPPSATTMKGQTRSQLISSSGRPNELRST